MANKYLRKVIIPAAGTATDLYEVPSANTGVIKSLRVTNNSAARSSIFVSQFIAGDATEHLLTNGFVLPIGASFDLFNGVSCVLEAGDKLTIESSQADVTFYLSYLELDRT
jgi:hypothetical protein